MRILALDTAANACSVALQAGDRVVISRISGLVPGAAVRSRVIDPETGLLPAPGQRGSIFETFRPEHVPTETRAPVQDASGDVPGEVPVEEPLF